MLERGAMAASHRHERLRLAQPVARSGPRAALVAVACLSLIVAIATSLRAGKVANIPGQGSAYVQRKAKQGRGNRSSVHEHTSVGFGKKEKSAKRRKSKGKASDEHAGAAPVGACMICGGGESAGSKGSKPKITSLSFAWSGTDLAQAGTLTLHGHLPNAPRGERWAAG